MLWAQNKTLRRFKPREEWHGEKCPKAKGAEQSVCTNREGGKEHDREGKRQAAKFTVKEWGLRGEKRSGGVTESIIFSPLWILNIFLWGVHGAGPAGYQDWRHPPHLTVCHRSPFESFPTSLLLSLAHYFHPALPKTALSLVIHSKIILMVQVPPLCFFRSLVLFKLFHNLTKRVLELK